MRRVDEVTTSCSRIWQTIPSLSRKLISITPVETKIWWALAFSTPRQTLLTRHKLSRTIRQLVSRMEGHPQPKQAWSGHHLFPIRRVSLQLQAPPLILSWLTPVTKLSTWLHSDTARTSSTGSSSNWCSRYQTQRRTDVGPSNESSRCMKRPRECLRCRKSTVRCRHKALMD